MDCIPTIRRVDDACVQTTALASVDLALLLAFDALLRERHVTRAAERVGLTQPALSHALRRLRELFDDPLFVRTKQGMLPTPRAEALAGPLREALASVERLVTPPEAVDLKTIARTFTIATNDFIEAVMVPSLISRLADELPRASLVVRPLTSSLEDQLESGIVDLGVGVFGDLRLGIVEQRLFKDHFACVVRRDHPTIGKKMTLEKFLAASHVLIAPRGTAGGPMDNALAERGLERRVVTRVPNFITALLLAAETDLVLTAPRQFLQHFASEDGARRRAPSGLGLALRVLPAPVEVRPFTMSMIWHERQRQDPAHAWLRRTIAALLV